MTRSPKPESPLRAVDIAAPAGLALASALGSRDGTPRALADFWRMAPDRREQILLDAICSSHAWHFPRNRAYRQLVEARGVGPEVEPDQLSRLLRPTAQTFKSYIDLLGSPFPQEHPAAFLAWLADQLSLDLPRERFDRFRPRYRSLEALLADFERIYADFGLEVLTSSGTSGRATIMLRDQEGLDLTTEAFYLAFQRYLGMQADHRAIFIMPKETRIAMARMAAFSVHRVGLEAERIHFTIPFSAQPDQVRIRAGRTFRVGLPGLMERKILHPFMGWMNERVVLPRAVGQTIALLQQAQAAGEKVLLFSGLVQLHAVALALRQRGLTLRLAPGSLLGSGGGLKELYTATPAQIHHDLRQVITLANGEPVPIRDTYGMAEGNWAAMQCERGNYHLPPWILARTLDGDDHLQGQPDSQGLLAFCDPYGGGRLFPPFFKTADRVRLIQGDADLALACPCGEPGSYLAQDSIQRVDRLDEAGCAAQV